MVKTRKSLYAEPEEGSGDPTDAALIEAARQIHGASDGWTNCEIEIDENATVSRGDDPGAYVQAWVWVPFCNVEEDRNIEKRVRDAAPELLAALKTITGSTPEDEGDIILATKMEPDDDPQTNAAYLAALKAINSAEEG